ncbi:MAG: glycosyl transferase, partial [Bryobacteraceae bacterium]
IFPLAAIGLFLGFTGGWRRWRELPLVSSAAVFLIIAVPWHLVVGHRVPGFYWFYFINEHFLRAVNRTMQQDFAPVPRLLWWAEHLTWLFPWSIFGGYALAEIPRISEWRTRTPGANVTRRREIEPRLLLLFWAGFILLFFSIATRLEYYSFAAWPAMALLLGAGLARGEENRSRWLPRLQALLAGIGALAAAVLCALLWLSRGVSSSGGIASLLHAKPEDYYRQAMSNMSDLTVQAFAALRGPAIGAAIVLLAGFGVAWVLRRKGRAQAATLATALAAAGFLFAAYGAELRFEPYLSSRALAEQISRYFQPGDRVLLYGDFYGGCTVSFYTHQKLWIWNGRYYGLAYGSNYPDAPQIFLNDSQFPGFWKGPERVFLDVPEAHRQEALKRLPRQDTYLVAESGGKAVYTNRPLRPGQLPIGPGSD